MTVRVPLGVALLLDRYAFRGVEFPLFLFAIALTGGFVIDGAFFTRLVYRGV